MKLKGMVALVTGSAHGLGREIAVSLAKGGATIAVHYHHQSASTTLREVRKYAKQSSIVKADVTDPGQVRKMTNKVVKKYGRLDILVNNVGSFTFKPLTKTTIDDFSSVLDTNLLSVFLVSQAALPTMRKNKRGAIINIGSSGCDRIQVRKNTTPYYIAKTGVLMLTKAMAAEERDSNVSINMVSPGILQSSIARSSGPMTCYEDVVSAILYVLRSRCISGANIEISGGWAPDVS